MTRSLLCSAIIAALGLHSGPSLGQNQTDDSATIYFNQNDFGSDTEGNFPGSVKLVQNVVMPTKHGVEGDIQQSPISLRKTMVMFKPQMELGWDEKVVLLAKDKRGRTVHRATMRTPRQLTRPAGQIQINKLPDQYDLVIENPASMATLGADTKGSHLATLLGAHDTIHIRTHNGIWSENFYLPKGPGYDNKIISFSDGATNDSTIHLNDGSTSISFGQQLSWVNVDGRWQALQASEQRLDEIVEADKVLEGNEAMDTLGADTQGEYLGALLSEHEHISIRTHNGMWTLNFYLPEGQQFHDKRVTFKHGAGFNSIVNYNGSHTTIRKGEELSWLNINGTWVSEIDLDYNRFQYSDNTYSSILPAAIIKPGLSLHFSSGDLNSHIRGLDIGAPNELLIHTIDIGMLTPPRNKYAFQDSPDLHRQFLQTVPARRLTVSNYQPLHLQEVMLPSGKFLTDFDPSIGDVHRGDMRDLIGKILISHGIDNANYGINSSGGIREVWHPFSSPQYTAHNSVGEYINGLQIHGLSGGHGMVTLAASIGNEVSHELGHNFGVGHFPGGFRGSINAPAERVNSTWGWDSDHDFFLPNFEKRTGGADLCFEDQCGEPYYGRRLNAGAMSGGWPIYPQFNNYTLYTPYELNLIQDNLSAKAQFSVNSPTGFFKWDNNNKVQRPWLNLAADDVNSAVKNRRVMRRPYKNGIAVTTIVAYYDPEMELQAYIYPALHGSFGAVYKDNFSPSRCQLMVDTQAGPQIYYLHDRRLDSGAMNKVHVNIDSSLHPSRAEISCDNEILDQRELAGPSQELHTYVVTAD
ncbi:MAG: M66 family metalloprotease [Cellvibrionaceae bacterium]|nr:M66 family metalloprotease [Cellvibrionaceae bacterium]